MWGLTESESLDDKEASEGCPHRGYPDNMPAYPSSLGYSEEPFEYRPGSLHAIHIEDSLDCGKYRDIYKIG